MNNIILLPVNKLRTGEGTGSRHPFDFRLGEVHIGGPDRARIPLVSVQLRPDR